MVLPGSAWDFRTTELIVSSMQKERDRVGRTTHSPVRISATLIAGGVGVDGIRAELAEAGLFHISPLGHDGLQYPADRLRPVVQHTGQRDGQDGCDHDREEEKRERGTELPRERDLMMRWAGIVELV